MEVSRNAAALMAAADEYARTASKYLWSQAVSPEQKQPADEPRQLEARLRLHFLFPQLSDWQRGLLLTVYWQRRAFILLIQADRKGLGEPLKTSLERLTTQIEQNFMSLIQSIRDLMPAWRLAPLQLEIFEAEFVAIPLIAVS